MLGPGRDIGAVLVNPVWRLVLIAPLIVAGLNLIVFRETHDTVCGPDSRSESGLDGELIPHAEFGAWVICRRR